MRTPQVAAPWSKHGEEIDELPVSLYDLQKLVGQSRIEFNSLITSSFWHNLKEEQRTLVRRAYEQLRYAWDNVHEAIKLHD